MKSITTEQIQQAQQEITVSTYSIETDQQFESVYKIVKQTLIEKNHFIVREDSNIGFLRTNPGLIGFYLGEDMEFYIHKVNKKEIEIELRFAAINDPLKRILNHRNTKLLVKELKKVL